MKGLAGRIFSKQRRSPTRYITNLWEERFDILATYNAEVMRGVVHTSEYDARMKILQDDYNSKYNKESWKKGYLVGS
uniref:Uncharacterized protein n=1 Tax=viral metagenome TaxID=1070528 RepID=A0A6M3X5P7_9ZZZZ